MESSVARAAVRAAVRGVRVCVCDNTQRYSTSVDLEGGILKKIELASERASN